MTHKTYFQVTGTIFLVIAIAHILRILYGWEAVINSWSVPMWISVLAIIVLGALSYHAFKFNRS